MKNSASKEDTKKNADRQASSATDESVRLKFELETVLEILENNDTNKLFAEPVDQKKVPSYYKIITKPMDLATLRGKLQKRLYTSLDEFERDVYLIFDNAMKFNPSTTIIYEEANKLHALASKNFLALKLRRDMIKFNNIVRSVEKRDEQDVKPIQTANSHGSSVGEPSAEKANSSVAQSSYGTYMGQGDIMCTGSRNVGVKNFSDNENPQTKTPLTPLNQTCNMASEVCQASEELRPLSFIPDWLQQNPPGYKVEVIKLDSSKPAQAGFLHASKEVGPVSLIPDRLQQNPPGYELDSSMPAQESLGHASDEFGPASFIPDWLQQNPPGYNVRIIDLNSSMPAQEGPGPAWNVSTMQRSDSNVRMLDKGKRTAPTVNSNKDNQSLACDQPVISSPPRVQNEGNRNSRLQGEEFPGHGAMMQPAVQLIPTASGLLTLESLNAGSGPIAFWVIKKISDI